MNVTKIFSYRLKKLREELKLSQAELAEKLGVSRGSISFYENEDRTPDIVFLEKTKKFFNVDLEYLLGYSDERKKLKSITPQNIPFEDNAAKKIIGIYNTDEDSFDLFNFFIENKNFYSFLQLFRCIIQDEKCQALGNFDDVKEFKKEMKFQSYEALIINLSLLIINMAKQIVAENTEKLLSLDFLLESAFRTFQIFKEAGLKIPENIEDMQKE